MRIIAGDARGRKLIAPDADDIRPTADRLRESLFNIIAGEIPDCRFLDLFSGTGAVGLEALSRGADFAVFVDNSPMSVDLINKNIALLRYGENSRVIYGSCLEALRVLSGENMRFGVIYMDPPYKQGLAQSCLELISVGGILAADGVIIVEQSSDEDAPSCQGLEILRAKKYKTTSFYFYTRSSLDETE